MTEQRETFIVRLWRNQAQTPWRGEVEHLQTRRVFHFTRFQALRDFIQNQLGSEDPKADDVATNTSDTSEDKRRRSIR